MTGRERFLCVLNQEKSDRLSCHVHSWMKYYLDTYLNGMDQYQAYEYFDMDSVTYCSPRYIYADADLALWQPEYVESPQNKDGEYHWQETIHTPEDTLMHEGYGNKYTVWITKHLVQNE